MGLGCLNDRIVGLSQHLLDEKIKNTTFTLPLNTVPKGSLDDLGKGDRGWIWPGPALQALMSLKVHRPNKDSEGKWRMMTMKQQDSPRGKHGEKPSLPAEVS